ncbi:hypothetical protein ES703_80779 [subsurface metagenome]
MLTDVHNCIGSEHIPNPAVVGVVLMGHGVVRAVIDGGGVIKESSWRLEPDENVAINNARN